MNFSILLLAKIATNATQLMFKFFERSSFSDGQKLIFPSRKSTIIHQSCILYSFLCNQPAHMSFFKKSKFRRNILCSAVRFEARHQKIEPLHQRHMGATNFTICLQIRYNGRFFKSNVTPIIKYKKKIFVPTDCSTTLTLFYSLTYPKTLYKINRYYLQTKKIFHPSSYVKK